MKIKSIVWDKRQITKPGVYEGIPLALYHDPGICVGPSISSSGMRKIFGDGTSPAHFYASWQGNPKYQPPAKTPGHYALGGALHHLVLGERFFAKVYCIQPDEWPDENGVLLPWRASRITCKKWLADRKKEGRIPLDGRQVEAIRQMAISVGNHPLVKLGALNGLIERSIFYKDKETGIWIKNRPDAIPTDSVDFVDLKTIRSIFLARKHVEDYQYHRQIAVSREAARIVLGAKMSSFTLLFVEANPPYDTVDIRCDDRDIDQAEMANRAAIRLFAKCLKDKKWPGIGEDVGMAKVTISEEARERMDKRLQYHGLGD